MPEPSSLAADRLGPTLLYMVGCWLSGGRSTATPDRSTHGGHSMRDPANDGIVPVDQATTKPACSIPKCNTTARRRGWCGMHYARWRRHGDPLATTRSPNRPENLSRAEIVERELSRATRDGECLISTASLSGNGYPQMRFKGRPHHLHRLVLTEKLGRDLQPGEQGNHRCHRQTCINPDHIYCGSQQENVNDMWRAGRANVSDGPRGEAHGMSKLTLANVREIRCKWASGGVALRDLAAEYGVAKVTISNVLRGQTWAKA